MRQRIQVNMLFLLSTDYTDYTDYTVFLTEEQKDIFFKSIDWTVDLYLTQTTQICAETMQDRTGLMKGIRRGIHCFARMQPSGR